MYVKGTGLRCVLVEYVTNEYNTRFHNPSCRTATLDFFSIWLNLKSQCFCALS